MDRATFEIPPPPVHLCARCGADGGATPPGPPWTHELLCPSCTEDWKRDQHERTLAALHERRHRFIRDRLADLDGRYPRMGWWSFDTYPDDDHTREARVLVQHWVEGTGFGDRDDPITAMALYIHGSVGVGKSGLAWSAMRGFIEQGLDADFRNVRDLLAGIRRSYSDPSAPDPLDGLATVSLLVLDDLGAERPTEWALETIASLIEERYQRELSTIVTTNYKPSELVKRLTPPKTSDTTIGQRIVSRLAEDCLQIHLDGPDRRLRNAA